MNPAGGRVTRIHHPRPSCQKIPEDFKKKHQDKERGNYPKRYPFHRRGPNRGIVEIFQPLQIGEYTGAVDPEDHLCHFENDVSLLHQYDDGVKCRVFLTILVGPTQRWFSHLKPRSIGSFKDFSALFLHHFASSKCYYKTPLSLFSMKQQNRETLRDYIQYLPSATSKISISAFSQGLMEDDFFRSLTKKPLAYDDLMGRVQKYFNMEKAQHIRK